MTIEASPHTWIQHRRYTGTLVLAGTSDISGTLQRGSQAYRRVLEVLIGQHVFSAGGHQGLQDLPKLLGWYRIIVTT